MLLTKPFPTNQKQKISVKNPGFTLMELLIALFVFSIVALLLSNGLKTVVNTYARTENHALQLRQLQLACLIISRDIEQVVNRPILNESGKETAAFTGTAHTMSFTHTGFPALGQFPSHVWRRSDYVWREGKLYRRLWPVLDRTMKTHPSQRLLLENVVDIKFSYLSANGIFQTAWPLSSQSAEILPRAVKVRMQLAHEEVLEQIFVIAAQNKLNKPAENPAQEETVEFDAPE